MAHSDDNNHLLSGERVKQLLKECGLTQAQLSEIMGVQPNAVSMIVRGKRRLTPDRARKITEHYPDYRVDWLLGIDEWRTEEEKKHDYEHLYPIALQAVNHQNAIKAVSTLANIDGYSLHLEYVTQKYRITKNGSLRACVNIEAFDDFVSDVQEYVKFKLMQLCKRVGEGNNG